MGHEDKSDMMTLKARVAQALHAEREKDGGCTTRLSTLRLIDAAIREIRRALGRRTAQPGSGNWAAELDSAIAGHNKSSHSAILDSDPNDVEGSDQLRFALRYENAEKMHENVELMNRRQENLEKAGAYRTLLHPLSFRRELRRAGQPNWSETVHTVRQVEGPTVTDVQGNVAQTKLVLPVPADSTEVSFQRYATGGSAQLDARRIRFLQPFANILKNRLMRESLYLKHVSRIMRRAPGFTQALKDARMPKVITPFLRVFPDLFVVADGKVRLTEAAAPPRPALQVARVAPTPGVRLRRKTTVPGI